MITHYLELITYLSSAWYLPIVVALGVFSITRIVVEDTLFDRQRNWFFDRFPHEGYTTKKRPHRGKFALVSNGYHLVTEGTKFGKLISCPWCSGFYVAVGVFGSLLFWPIWTTLVLWPLALRVIPGLIWKE